MGEKKNAYQYDLLKTPDENNRDSILFANGFTLPVSQMQVQQAVETPELTQRELEIMEMTLRGSLIPKIAVTLPLSIAGVKWRLSHIYAKFGVSNRLELIEKAVSKGIQFYSTAGVLHTFNVKIYLRDQSNLTDKDERHLQLEQHIEQLKRELALWKPQH